MMEKPLVVDAHMGGHFGPHIKYSGYDAIIVEGASDTPVWVKINDDKIEFNDAADLWGKGTRETARVIGEAAGAQYCVCCTGTAGDNMVRSSIILNDVNHAAGAGAGYVWGAEEAEGHRHLRRKVHFRGGSQKAAGSVPLSAG